MKKYVKYLSLLLLSLFFILPGKVDALSVSVNFDENEHFNYFYEYKNQTPFYNFLKQYGDNLVEILNDYMSIDKDFDSIYIYFAKDISGAPSNAKYVIVRSYSNSLFSDGSIINFSNNYHDGIYYFFDENSEFLYADYNYSGLNHSYSYFIPNFDFSIKEDIHYLISNIYYSDLIFYDSSSRSKPDLVVTNAIIDGKNYIIDDNENYNSFLNWIRAVFTSQSIKDFNDSILEYFIKFKLLSSDISMRSCYEIVNYGKGYQITLPDNYSFKILNTESNLFLVPKQNVLSDNSKIYVSSTGKHDIGVRYWHYSDNKFSNNIESEKRFYVYQVDTIGEFNILDNNKLPSNNYFDFVYHIINYSYYESSKNPFSVNSVEYKYPITIYYDPSFYDVYSLNGDGLNFTFYDGANYFISNDDINKTDHTGASIDIFKDPDKQEEIGKQYSEIYEYDEDGNIVAVKGLELNGKTFFSFFNTMYSNITSFMSLVGLTFQSLPSEVQNLFLFTLFASVIVIVRKLIIG